MFHYKPTDGYFGDPIPFYWEGVYHLFYLKAPLEPLRHGADHTPYAHISTTDFIQWREHPLVISPDPDGPDAKSCWTGSIIEKDGIFYLFYTGHDGGHPTRPQSICLATSRDLDHWEKAPNNPILLPDLSRYAITDWRDPFVFWYEEEDCYLMSITTILKDGGFWKGGALVMARSRDLQEWNLEDVYYSPGNHGYPECSDLFKIGNYWYLVCSIFDKTCYRIGESPRGPWRAGVTDSFDGVLNYAIKTLSDGRNHFALGWIRTKQGCRDSGNWEWAGYLSFPRQLVQQSDGSLFSKIPEWFASLQSDCCFTLSQDSNLVKPIHGVWKQMNGQLAAEGSHLYSEIQFPGDHDDFYAEIRFRPEGQTKRIGLVFHNDPKSNHPGYEICVDLQHNLLLFRKHTKRFYSYTTQDICLEPGEAVHLRIIIEKGIVEATLNNRFTLSSAFYHYSKEADLSFFVEEGSGTLESAVISNLAAAPQVIPLVEAGMVS